MQKRLLGLMVLIPSFMYALTDHISRSFMFTRPANHNLPMLQSLWHSKIYEDHGPLGGSLQIVPFYNDSTDHGSCNHKTAQYFYPSCQTPVYVLGDNAEYTTTGTYIRAEWLGLPTDFVGNFSFDPKQKQYGCVFEYSQALSELTDNEFLDHWLVGIRVPYEVVKNNLTFTQFAETTTMADGVPDTICEAFNQDSWNYAKLAPCEKKVTGVGNVRFQLTANIYAKKGYEAIYYTFLALNSGDDSDPRYLFSPYIGNNKHVGYGNAVCFQLPITRKSNQWPIRFFMNVEHQYLFARKQYRTFDLKDKPWSRYLLLYHANDTVGTPPTPGVNVLTQRVKVHPDSFVDFVTGFRLAHNGFEAELAYNLWAHRGERIEYIDDTVCSKCNNFVDIREYGIAGTAAGYTASKSTIAARAANDSTFTALRYRDIDKYSGAAASATTHKVHAAIGYGTQGEKFDGFCNFGAFFEYPQNNAALAQWGIWGKAGASF
ncbi:hypothetical protein JW872_00030 [Candidatus Babeliales bacterium]|nr:hypothetical protein [Candidatus Babeliales bacterium]